MNCVYVYYFITIKQPNAQLGKPLNHIHYALGKTNYKNFFYFINRKKYSLKLH